MVYLQYFIPHQLINKLASLLGNCTTKWLKNFLIHFFIKHYITKPIDWGEYEHSNPFYYKSYNDFFTRKLRTNVRTIDLDPRSIISPADGYITQYGNIESSSLITAKGACLSLNNLLGNQLEDPFTDPLFENGKFLTIYLAPHNYHRIHMPITAILEKMIYIPGKLFSVNEKTVNKISNIFTKNERVVVLFNSKVGKIGIVLVGAMIVGSIVTSWHGQVTTRGTRNRSEWKYENNMILQRGIEMGFFQLGSTVIVLFEKNVIDFTPKIFYGNPIKMGETIGLIPHSLKNTTIR